MAKGKAESLDDVLALARMRRQSGILTIEHTQGGRVEEGEVYLQVGQPVYARVGQLVGQDALNWLLKWRSIYFTIGPEDPGLPVGTPATGNGTDNGTATAPSLRAAPSLSQNPQLVGDISRKLASERFAGDGNDSSQRNSVAPGVEWFVPQKRSIDRDVLSLPLTRRQRFIYFLVDGRRTISDLSRCTGKNIQEVELILRELQEQGLVAV